MCLNFHEIRGRREYVVRGARGGTRYLKLVPADDRREPLQIRKQYNFDAEFYAWFNRLPDLDALDSASTNFDLSESGTNPPR